MMRQDHAPPRHRSSKAAELDPCLTVVLSPRRFLGKSKFQMSQECSERDYSVRSLDTSTRSNRVFLTPKVKGQEPVMTPVVPSWTSTLRGVYPRREWRSRQGITDLERPCQKSSMAKRRDELEAAVQVATSEREVERRRVLGLEERRTVYRELLCQAQSQLVDVMNQISDVRSLPPSRQSSVGISRSHAAEDEDFKFSQSTKGRCERMPSEESSPSRRVPLRQSGLSSQSTFSRARSFTLTQRSNSLHSSPSSSRSTSVVRNSSPRVVTADCSAPTSTQSGPALKCGGRSELPELSELSSGAKPLLPDCVCCDSRQWSGSPTRATTAQTTPNQNDSSAQHDL